jgi:hypothetical protein
MVWKPFFGGGARHIFCCGAIDAYAYRVLLNVLQWPGSSTDWDAKHLGLLLGGLVQLWGV